MSVKSLIPAICLVMVSATSFAQSLSCGELAVQKARAAQKQYCNDSPFKCSADEDIYYAETKFDQVLCQELPACEGADANKAAKNMYANDCSYF